MADTANTVERGEETILGKLTLKEMGCNPSMVKTLREGEKTYPLARIYGVALKVGKQEDRLEAGRIHTFFQGQFEGINLDTGEVFSSGKLYLPGGLSEQFEAFLTKALETDPKTQVQFGFEIASQKATNPIGYSYVAAPFHKPEKNDALAALRAAMKSLPAVKPKTLEGTVNEPAKQKKSA